jgi:hypothetical protein
MKTIILLSDSGVLLFSFEAFAAYFAGYRININGSPGYFGVFLNSTIRAEIVYTGGNATGINMFKTNLTVID